MIRSLKKTIFFPLELIPGEAFRAPRAWLDGHQAFIPLSEFLIINPSKDKVAEEDVILFGRRMNSQRQFPLVWHKSGEVRCAIDLPKWFRIMQQELYRPEHTKPITARLPFHYHKIPGVIRNFFALALLRAKKVRENEVYPVSPLNPGCEILLTVCEMPKKQSNHPIVVLTHDIDTKDGLIWIRRIAQMEEEHGLRSSWNVVPKSYLIDKDLLHDLKARGHEIGLHGIWHNNQEAFLSREILHQEFSKLQPLISEFRIRGYRGPSWYRTRVMFDVLAKFFEYDSSCLDNDFICPGGSGGVGMIRPFRIRDELVEIPCTLPFEAPLFLAHSSDSMLGYWLPKIKWIRNVGGLLVVNTHPDPNYLGNEQMLKVYQSLLDYLNQEGWQGMLPHEIAKSVA